MGFKEVFATLQDTFPQVDFRLLKAVAIEHSNDADAAAEFVIAEVLSTVEPIKEVKGKSSAGSSRTKGPASAASSGAKDSPAAGLGVGPGKEAVYFIVDENEEENDFHLSRAKLALRPNYLVRTYDDESENSDPLVGISGYSIEPNSLTKQVSLEEITGVTKSDTEHCKGQSDTNSIVENVVLHHKMHTQSTDSYGDVSDVVFSLNSATNMQMTVPTTAVAQEGNDADISSSTASSKMYSEKRIDIEDEINSSDVPQALSQYSFEPPEKPSIKGNNTLDQNDLLFSGSSMLDSTEHHNDIINLTSDMVDTCDKQHLTSLKESSADLLHLEAEMRSSDDYLNATALAQSSQLVGIDFLESFVADAKCNKENLVASVESVINMVASVTVLEEKAKRATEEASDAGQETLNKVEELKKTLKHAKEQNEMTAGEIYGEKAILATEARELQSRLLSLSDERDNALLIVQQIREALQLRIVAAEAELAASENEKLEKEALAQAALEEQELIMISIVEESKRLHQEAEENSKMREFLMDRGRNVDILQGEIAVICEDVLALKERVDSGMPLKKLSQSTPSSLASSLSLSSIRSRSSTDVVLQPVDVNNFSSANILDNQNTIQPDDKLQPEDKICLDDQKEPTDEEWEIFEMI